MLLSCQFTDLWTHTALNATVMSIHSSLNTQSTKHYCQFTHLWTHTARNATVSSLISEHTQHWALLSTVSSLVSEHTQHWTLLSVCLSVSTHSIEQNCQFIHLSPRVSLSPFFICTGDNADESVLIKWSVSVVPSHWLHWYSTISCCTRQWHSCNIYYTWCLYMYVCVCVCQCVCMPVHMCAHETER